MHEAVHSPEERAKDAGHHSARALWTSCKKKTSASVFYLLFQQKSQAVRHKDRKQEMYGVTYERQQQRPFPLGRLA